MKKLVSFVLALVLAASLLPVQVWAEEIDTTGNDTAQGDTLPESSLQEEQNDNTELLPIPEEQSAPLALAAAQENETTPMQSSDGIVASGTCGADANWELDKDGILHITGAGAMFNWGQSDAPWYDYNKDIIEVVIDTNITHVGDYAFFDWDKNAYCQLAVIHLPETLASIGQRSFMGCKAIKEIYIPNGVTTIGSQAFRNCSSLSDVSGGEGIVAIDSYAFWGCSALKAITFGGIIDSIGEGAFLSCRDLSIALFCGNAPTSFGGSATSSAVFDDVSANFTIFYRSGTTGWTSPTWKGYPAVCRDDVATDFSTLDSDNRNVQGVYFRLNNTAMTATVGKNTTTDNNAGYAGGQSGNIVIPDTVMKDEKTYDVIGVNQYAFANCAWINSISIGRNVSSIEPSAFRGCKNLTAITVSQDNLQFADQNGVLFDKCGLYLYAYPAGRTDMSYTIPDSCDTVGTLSFYGAVHLTYISVPDSVKNIGAKAFAQCNALEEAVLPFLGGNAESTSGVGFVFDGYEYNYNKLPASLKRITVHGTNLFGQAFRECNNLEEIYLPDCHALTDIPNDCFFECRSLHTISFDGNAPSQYGVVTIPDTVTKIERIAFNGCESIRGVTLGRGVVTLGDAAFENCVSIEWFAVAAGNTAFMADQWGVLYGTTQQTLYYYPSGRAWPYYNVNAATTCIGSYAFSSCNNLVNLFVPESVTSFTTTYYDAPCISNCPGTTICCYKGSPVARYAIENGLTPWYMDNYTMQGITVEKLPEYIIINSQGELLNAPYVTATYGDKKLQLDDYDVQFASAYGEQTLTFSSGNVSTEVVATVVRQGNINGDSASGETDIDASDMQCLYTYLTTGRNEGKLKGSEYFDLVADVNGDDSIDVYDLQRLYEAVNGMRPFA